MQMKENHRISSNRNNDYHDMSINICSAGLKFYVFWGQFDDHNNSYVINCIYFLELII